MSIFILLYFCTISTGQEGFDFNNFNENSNIDDFNPDMSFKPSDDFLAQMMAMAAEKLGDKFKGSAAWGPGAGQRIVDLIIYIFCCYFYFMFYGSLINPHIVLPNLRW